MELVLNNELKLQYPEGFHVLSDEERSKMNVMEGGQWAGISDPERHILVTAGCKQLGGFASMMLSGQDLAKKLEKQISSSMAPLGFKSCGARDRQIGSVRALGTGYEYTAQETGMYAESYVIKKDKTVYYLHFYARSALKDESLSVWNGMLDQIKL